MNKLITLATLVGSASAFAPTNTKASNSALQMADARSPDGLGVDPGPLDLWDPLGFVEDEESFARRRAVERPGFDGAQCGININDCRPNPCKNGGRCTDGINKFTCRCQTAKWRGNTCEDAV